MLRLRDVSVVFPGVRALDGACLDLHGGQVHGLMGANGAGKSTLLKVLGGIEQPGSGTIEIDGVAVTLPTPRAAFAAGVAVIHQELHSVPDQSVAENLALGQLPQRFGFVDGKRLNEQARQVLAQLGEEIDPRARMRDLSIAQRQMVEIGKALQRDARIIAFDEPTSSLSARETDRLVEIIMGLKARDCAILYVTHRLEEVYRLCDRVTVFRDGRHVTTIDDARAADRDTMITAMAGRAISDLYGYRPRNVGAEALTVEGVTGRGVRAGVSLSVRRGEIVGLFGLVGAGRSELLDLIYGAAPMSSGSVQIDGAASRLGSPRGGVAARMGLCPEDRKRDGIVPTASVGDNLTLASAGPGWFRKRGHERRTSLDQIARLSIKTPGPDTPITALSGGNQQKVILARWLANDTEIFLMDEPTRGIDVGARSDLYAAMYDLTEVGKAILMVSSDAAEVIGVADRIIVMRDGAVSGEVTRVDATPERLLSLALPA